MYKFYDIYNTAKIYILCFKFIGLFSSLKNEASISSKKYKNYNKPVEDENNGKNKIHFYKCVRCLSAYILFFFLDIHKQTIQLLTGIKFEIKSLAYSAECLQNITKTIVEKLSAKEATQCNDENVEFYNDVWPIECESDLNQQEECLQDLTRRNAMVSYSFYIIYIYIYIIITLKYNIIIDWFTCIYIYFSVYLF